MSAPPQAIAPNPHTNLQISNKMWFQKKIFWDVAHIVCMLTVVSEKRITLISRAQNQRVAGG
jgi:hypothetical protein